jgi:transcriptional antiterminator RfaH
MEVENLTDKTKNKNWYAIYTRPRAEKAIYKALVESGIETFLPLQKTLRQWSDRKKIVEVPLFSSYVFVFVGKKEYHLPLKVHGVVKYVGFEGKAVRIPQQQIDNLHLIVNSNADVEKSDLHFIEGQKVEVIMGSLKGLKGELVKYNQRNRVLVRIDHLDQNLLVNIPKNYLQ